MNITDGHFICCENFISVVYYGDNKTLKIVAIQPLDDAPPARATTETRGAVTEADMVIKRMSELTMASEERKESSERGCPFRVFKITSRSKIKIVEGTQETEKVSHLRWNFWHIIVCSG